MWYSCVERYPIQQYYIFSMEKSSSFRFACLHTKNFFFVPALALTQMHTNTLNKLTSRTLEVWARLLAHRVRYSSLTARIDEKSCNLMWRCAREIMKISLTRELCTEISLLSEPTTPPPPFVPHKNSSQSRRTANIHEISAHFVVRPCQKVPH